MRSTPEQFCWYANVEIQLISAFFKVIQGYSRLFKPKNNPPQPGWLLANSGCNPARTRTNRGRRLWLAKSGDRKAKKCSGFANPDVARFLPMLDRLSRFKTDRSIMSFLPTAGSTRRKFFRDAVRYGLLSALAALASVTGTRRVLGSQSCVNRGLCGGCVAFAGCGLPQALSVKSFRRGGKSEVPGEQS
jgi:hypothetical protein